MKSKKEKSTKSKSVLSDSEKFRLAKGCCGSNVPFFLNGLEEKTIEEYNGRKGGEPMNKKKRAGQALALAGVLVLAICPGSPVQGKYAGAEPSARAARVQETLTPARPGMAVHPIAFTDLRRRLMRDYARIHYGQEMETIVPRAVVVHWTASSSRDGVYRYFYPCLLYTSPSPRDRG